MVLESRDWACVSLQRFDRLESTCCKYLSTRSTRSVHFFCSVSYADSLSSVDLWLVSIWRTCPPTWPMSHVRRWFVVLWEICFSINSVCCLVKFSSASYISLGHRKAHPSVPNTNWLMKPRRGDSGVLLLWRCLIWGFLFLRLKVLCLQWKTYLDSLS